MRRLVIVCLLAACGAPPGADVPGEVCTGKCDDPTNDPLWADKVMAEAAAVLGRERGRSFRYAFDRAMSTLGAFKVEPYPSVSCNGGPEQLYWNGDDRSLVRLGLVGLANVVALEAISQNSYADYHVKWLSAARGSDANAQKALGIIASIESPRLLIDATSALVNNPYLSKEARATLLAFEADLFEKKEFRAADLSFRLPDFSHPPSVAALLQRLRRSPGEAYRQTVVSILEHDAAAASPADVDALIEDPAFAVRVAAMRLFWRSSDLSPKRQNDLLAWIRGTEAKRQIRLRFLGVTTDQQAAGWAEEPEGFAAYYQETLAEFVGNALHDAPPNKDMRPFLDASTRLLHVTNIVEDSIRVALRSSVLSATEKEQTLVALLANAEALAWDNEPTSLNLIYRLLAQRILAAPRQDLVDTLKNIYLPNTVDRNALMAKMVSPDAATRLAGVQMLAQHQAGFMAALFDAKVGTEALLEKQNGAVMLAALENGIPPQAIIDRVLGMAFAHHGDTEPYLEFWAASETPYMEALIAALESPMLPGTARTKNIIAFAQVVSPRNTIAPTGAPGPGAPYLGSAVQRIFALLGDPALAAADRKAAWQSILVRNSGALRNHLLEYTPNTGPIRQLVQDLAREHLIETATTCWQGHTDPNFERPGISIWMVPFALAAPQAAIDPNGVVEARITALRTEIADKEALALDATVTDVLTKRPGAKDGYLGAWPWTKAQREPFELSAADLVSKIMAAPADQSLEVLITALSLAPAFRQLPQSTFDQLEAKLTASNPYDFVLRLARRDSYDALAARFRAGVALRWDLADEARPKSETAALERLLATAEPQFGVDYRLQLMVARVAARTNVSERFRISLTELAADGWNGWSSAQLPLIRIDLPSLDALLLRGAAERATQTQAIDLPPAGLFGIVAKDPRLSSQAAVRLAWIILTSGRFTETDFHEFPAAITTAIDLTLGLFQRADIDAAEKKALGQALLTVTESR